LDEDKLARAIPQGSALQESNAVVKLRKLMEDVGDTKIIRIITMNEFICIFYILIIGVFFVR